MPEMPARRRAGIKEKRRAFDVLRRMRQYIVLVDAVLILRTLWPYALCLLIGASGAYQAQEWRYGERMAELNAKSQKALQTAESEARATESRMQTAIDNLQAKANERETKYNADLAAANARADSLRDTRDKRTSRAIEDTRTTGGGEAARQTLRVYSELLDRADARDREVSEFADRANEAGLNCVHAYNEIRSATK